MTRNEAIKLLSQIMDALLISNSWLPSTDNPIKEAFGMAISALQAQESCNNFATDTISRQAAIDALNEYFTRIGRLKRKGLSKGEKAISLDTVGTIKTLPSTQLRPKGEWVYEKINSYTDRTYCSECGSHAPFEYVTDDHYGRHAHGEIWKTNFCPNCGADLRGEKDE